VNPDNIFVGTRLGGHLGEATIDRIVDPVVVVTENTVAEQVMK